MAMVIIDGGLGQDRFELVLDVALAKVARFNLCHR